MDISGKAILNEVIIDKIKEYKAHEFKKFYGYRLITRELRKDLQIKINHKKVFRLMKELKLLIKRRKSKLLLNSKRCKNRKVTGSNQLWESDIKYLPIAGEKKTVYKITIIDVYDKDIVAYDIVDSCTSKTASKLLLTALYNRNLKGKSKGLIVRTDNGSQYVSENFIGTCINEEIIHERIPPRSPNYNAHIESYHRYLDDNCLRGQLYLSREELEAKISRYINFYRKERPHSSLEYNTPEQVYKSNGEILRNPLEVNL